jgi:hypothetical protein
LVAQRKHDLGDRVQWQFPLVAYYPRTQGAGDIAHFVFVRRAVLRGNPWRLTQNFVLAFLD